MGGSAGDTPNAFCARGVDISQKSVIWCERDARFKNMSFVREVLIVLMMLGPKSEF